MDLLPSDDCLNVKEADKIWVSEFLEDNDIAYTGSDRIAHELEHNKPLAKQRVLDSGLETSPFFVVKQNNSNYINKTSIKFPVFIKPTDRGGGLGIDSSSVAHNHNELNSKIRLIAKNHKSDSLVEEFLPGREFSVAILKEVGSAYMAMPIELIAQPDKHGLQLLGGKLKSANSEQVIEVTDKIIKAKVTNLAISVFNILEARDYGRIDIRLDKYGTPQFLEANLIPSLISGYGSFPKACMINKNLDYEPMILNIVNLALSRNPHPLKNVIEDIGLNKISSQEPVLEAV
jgi:D-alanine-D-alanine ligase